MDDQLEIWVEGQSRDHARMIVPKGYIVTGKAVVDRNTGKRMWKAVRCDDPANLVQCEKAAAEQRRGGPKGSEGYYQYMQQKQAENVARRQAAEQAAAARAGPTLPGGMVLVGGVLVGGILIYLGYRYFIRGD